jgi:hypothetical protein
MIHTDLVHMIVRKSKYSNSTLRIVFRKVMIHTLFFNRLKYILLNLLDCFLLTMKYIVGSSYHTLPIQKTLFQGRNLCKMNISKMNEFIEHVPVQDEKYTGKVIIVCQCVLVCHNCVSSIKLPTSCVHMQLVSGVRHNVYIYLRDLSMIY